MGDNFGLDPRKPAAASGFGLLSGTLPGSVLVWNGSAWVERLLGDHVLLGALSDPNADPLYLCTWWAREFIALDSAKRTLSVPDFSQVAGYVATESEIIDKLSAKFSSGILSNRLISVWVKPDGGVEADTGIVIDCPNASTFAQNLTESITLNAGDELKFMIDIGLTIQHMTITGRRRAVV